VSQQENVALLLTMVLTPDSSWESLSLYWATMTLQVLEACL